jgi:hypothetical protein
MIILLHDSACPHIADLTKVTLATVGWEIINHPLCTPDLAPSDFDLFGLVKVDLGGQKCQTADEVRHSVLN